MSDLQLYAQPYDTSATGFYFSTFEEYEKKRAENRNPSGGIVEEYEIQLIDGDEILFQVASVREPNQSNLDVWLDSASEIELLDADRQAGLVWLLSAGVDDIDAALIRLEDVQVYSGSLHDCAFDYINECYNLQATMGHLASYFDYEAFARDATCGGDWVEFQRGYIITNANDF